MIWRVGIGALLGVLLGGLGAISPAVAQSVPATQCVTTALAGGTANAITVPLLPCTGTTTLLVLTLSASNTSTSVTLQETGFAALPVQNSDGTLPGVGRLSAGNKVLLTNTGSAWQILNTGTIAEEVAVGSTSVTSGTSNGLLYNNAGTLGNLATANSGVLVTNGTGVPAIATTLPSGITIPGATITGSSIAAGTLSAQSVSGNVAPHVATLAALQSSCVSSTGCPGSDPVFTNGTWRDDYAAGNGAAPLFYLGETGTCSANSRINDGGSCVNTTSGDGNSFYAVWPNGNIDVREFGAVANDSTDDTAAVNAAIAYVETTSTYSNALNSAQTARACIYFPSNPLAYRFLSTPNMAQDGLCVRGDGKTVSLLHFIDVSALQVKSNSDFSDFALIGTAPTSSVSTATYGLWTDGTSFYEQPILRNIRISGFVQCEHFPGGFDNAKVDYVDCDDHNWLYPNLTNGFPGPGIWLSQGGSYAPAGNRWIGGEVRRQAFQQSQSYTGNGTTTNFDITLTVSGKNFFDWAADGIVAYNLSAGQTEWSVGTVGGQARCGSDRDYTIWDVTSTATQLGCHYMPSVSFTAGSPNATITTGYTDVPTGATSLADSIDLPPNTTVVSYNSTTGALVLSQNAQRNGNYALTMTQVAVSGTNANAACQASVTCGHVLEVRFNSAPANGNTVTLVWDDPWAFASIYDEGGSDNHFIDINQISGDRRLFVHGGQGSAYGGDIFAPDYVEITHTCASVLNVASGPTGNRPQGDRVTIQHALLPAFQCPGTIDSTAGEVYVDFNQHVSTYNFAGEQELSYTPTITCGSGAVGTYSKQIGLYGISGHRVTIYSLEVQAAVGTCSGLIKISLPVTASNVARGTLTAFDNTTSPFILGSFIGTGAAFVEVFNSTGANPPGGDDFILSGSYAQ